MGRVVTYISHPAWGGHFCWNCPGWRPHTDNPQHPPSWRSLWRGCCCPGTASSSLWAVDSSHWRTSIWRSQRHLRGRSGRQGPYVLWLWYCWFRWRAVPLGLWRNRGGDWLRIGQGPGATLLPQRSQPPLGPVSSVKVIKVMGLSSLMICKERAAPPLWGLASTVMS